GLVADVADDRAGRRLPARSPAARGFLPGRRPHGRSGDSHHRDGRQHDESGKGVHGRTWGMRACRVARQALGFLYWAVTVNGTSRVSEVPLILSVTFTSRRKSPSGKLASGTARLPGSWWPAARSNCAGSVWAFITVGSVRLKNFSPPSGSFWWKLYWTSTSGFFVDGSVPAP